MSPARSSRSWSRTRASESGPRRNSYEPRRSVEQITTTGHDRNEEYQRFILTDPIAARYLEHDSCVTVLEQRREIESYQAAIVEQWATSRNHPTFTITIHTADASDKIVARILGIPKDENIWSPRLRIYFKALNHYHARRRDTPDGVLMVTSLSGFPSSLTVILVPGGDVSKHYADFFINEDLKRLGCSGRVGLSLSHPNNSTVAKYHQLYRTNDKNALYSSVIELVRMCQIALHIFGVLDQEYIDGLLCDFTENAVSKWWRLVGMDVYNTSPHDGALGPTSVSALLGLLLGARNRMNSLGVPVPKDPFDLKGMKKGILNFQKSQKLHRNGRLDELSLRKLFVVTEKAVHTEGVFRVPKAVKTTVAELSGKGEEMAAEGGSRKGKAGIAEMETTDIDVFAQLAYGERCKWLWHGKAMKKTKTATVGEGTLDGIILSKGPAHDSGKKQVMTEGHSRTSLDENWSDHANRSPRRSLEEVPRDHFGAAARRVHGVFDDGRAGLDRFIGVVNPIKRTADAGTPERMSSRDAHARLRRPHTFRSHTSPTSPNKTLGSPLSEAQNLSSTEISPIDINVLNQSRASIVRERSPQAQAASKDLNNAIHPHRIIRRQVSRVPDVSRHAEADGRRVTDYHGVNLDEYLPVPPNPEQDVPPLLRRTQSLGALHIPQEFRGRIRHGRLSFSLAESGMVMSNGMLSTADSEPFDDPDAEYVRQRFVAEHLRSVRQAIKDLSRHEATWTTVQMEKLETHVQTASEDQEMLQLMLEAPARAGHELQETATMVLQDGQGILNEGKRELESLAAKLDYEINILEGKIEDVERGVGELDRALQVAETRVDDVERDVLRGGSWVCAVM